jgi:hypothetical protein
MCERIAMDGRVLGFGLNFLEYGSIQSSSFEMMNGSSSPLAVLLPPDMRDPRGGL